MKLPQFINAFNKETPTYTKTSVNFKDFCIEFDYDEIEKPRWSYSEPNYDDIVSHGEVIVNDINIIAKEELNIDELLSNNTIKKFVIHYMEKFFETRDIHDFSHKISHPLN